jgi:alkanesulfonate monooxygenase SsuD/methylene tetrahydromethanopterin reductase-like flavin-dependent oxidoreductase (luciferase family)
MVEPSPQRMPVAFQAGSSDDGREFSARNAEAMFISASTPADAQKLMEDVTARLAKYGRSREDIVFMLYMNVVVASTEEEAKRKADEIDEQLGSEGAIAFMSSAMGADMSQVDLDRPLKEFKTDSIQGILKKFAESVEDKTFTFRDMVRATGSDRIIGPPELIADELEKWRDAGVDGININLQDVRNTYDFAEHAAPVLQERGLMQREYRSGTFRDKLFRR